MLSSFHKGSSEQGQSRTWWQYSAAQTHPAATCKSAFAPRILPEVTYVHSPCKFGTGCSQFGPAPLQIAASLSFTMPQLFLSQGGQRTERHPFSLHPLLFLLKRKEEMVVGGGAISFCMFVHVLLSVCDWLSYQPCSWHHTATQNGLNQKSAFNGDRPGHFPLKVKHLWQAEVTYNSAGLS